MPDAEWLRPSSAAAKFDVSERTLNRWSNAGLIGSSRIGHILLYRAADIADVIASGATPRTVVPMQPGQPTVSAADEWQADPLWGGGAR
jgi:hypothetical protein